MDSFLEKQSQDPLQRITGETTGISSANPSVVQTQPLLNKSCIKAIYPCPPSPLDFFAALLVK